MALVACRLCKEKISEQANPCPRCGEPDPAVPYELDRLRKELAKLEEEEKEYIKKTEDAQREILQVRGNLFLRNKAKRLEQEKEGYKYTVIQVQEKKRAKREEIYNFERNMHRPV